MTFTRAQETLLALIAESLFGQPFTPTSDTDWSGVYAESRAQAVTLLAFQKQRELPLEAEQSQKIEQALQKHTLLNVRNFQNHAHLHRLMTEAGISYCVLKGIASAHYYPAPLTRAMGDVDFYVSPADADRTRQVLEADGFTADEKEQTHHQVFRKPGMHYELHREVAGVPEGRAGEMIRGYLADLTDCATPVFDEFVTYRNPSPFHHGLIMLLHMQHHLLSEGIGLRHLCDWAVFVGSLPEEEFTALFAEKLQAVGLWRFAQTLSLAAFRGIGLPKASWMGEDADLADALLEDILLGGNFGRKQAGRNYEGMFISNRGKNGVKKGRLRQGFASLNRIVRWFWPIAERVPILYPIGWIFFPIRYLFRVLTGKHKAVSVVEIFENSGKRKELYGKLKLYEMNEE
ncbi:MAG: nucleotidyltransferase family protein [Clostridia bacterium]|nr:nucleotidyltransferase family protein [Clostridia bacterium]